MRALSIRQPYAEEILRGIKKIEYRSRRVSDELMRERFYIYAAKGKGSGVRQGRELRSQETGDRSQ